jgi:hypothetical protein
MEEWVAIVVRTGTREEYVWRFQLGTEGTCRILVMDEWVAIAVQEKNMREEPKERILVILV